MNVLVTLIPGALLGIGVIVIVAGLLPTQPRLSSALERLGTTTAPATVGKTDLATQIGSWLQRQLPDGDRNDPALTTITRWFTIPKRDLAIVGIPVTKYLSDKALLAALGLVAPSILGLMLQAVGIAPFYLPGLLGIPAAVVLWFAPDQDLHAKAALARDDFARSVAVYLELVAAERRRGAPASEAPLSAAYVGRSWVFIRIRQELNRARLAGVDAWDALTSLSVELGVPELDDVARIVRLAGHEGAAVYETLRSRGKSLRVELLNNDHTRANEASERMTIPMAALAIVFVAIIMTPLVLNLFAS